MYDKIRTKWNVVNVAVSGASDLIENVTEDETMPNKCAGTCESVGKCNHPQHRFLWSKQD